MSKEALFVVDGDERVPFLRGVITHSLTARGLPFEAAYATAREIRSRLADATEIDKASLYSLIQSVVRERYDSKYPLDAPLGAQATIEVVGGGLDLPFSKGVLLQSLQAAGLEPAAGFEMAREIEADLLRKGRSEVTRDELRHRVYEALRKHRDEDCAERYLLWRWVRRPGCSLVLLFGGATGTGKSVLAAEVAHRLEIRQVLSTDTVRQIMRLMLSADLLPALHVSSYEAWKTIPGSTGKKERDVVEAFNEQSRRVLVGVRAILNRAATEGLSLIVEGVHLVPGLLDTRPPDPDMIIVPIVLSTLNKKIHLQRFPKRESQARRRTAHNYEAHFHQIQIIQNYILEMADEQDAPIVETRDLDETAPRLLSVIAQSVRKHVAITRKQLLRDTLG